MTKSCGRVVLKDERKMFNSVYANLIKHWYKNFN